MPRGPGVPQIVKAQVTQTRLGHCVLPGRIRKMGRGLATHYLLLVIGLADRVVQVLGVTAKPDETWILQIARNLIDTECGALCGKRYIIIDHDTKYTDQFRELVRESGNEVIRLPPMSPNLNAYAERFVRSITRRVPESFDIRRAGVASPCGV
jgi:hypothetical protein